MTRAANIVAEMAFKRMMLHECNVRHTSGVVMTLDVTATFCSQLQPFYDCTQITTRSEVFGSPKLTTALKYRDF